MLCARGDSIGNIVSILGIKKVRKENTYLFFFSTFFFVFFFFVCISYLFVVFV